MISICLGFGEELRVLEGLQVIAFFSNPYHPYYSIAPGLSKVSPSLYWFPIIVRPSANVLGGSEALSLCTDFSPHCTECYLLNLTFSPQLLNQFPQSQRRWTRLVNSFLTIYNTRHVPMVNFPPIHVNKTQQLPDLLIQCMDWHVNTTVRILWIRAIQRQYYVPFWNDYKY